MTRALLLLTGGRSLPDMLFVKYMIEHWHPDFIYTITTRQGKKDAENLKHFAQKHFHSKIDILPIIDPFQEEQVKASCRKAFSSKPDAEWICHFTSSPKAVGLYAREVAQGYGVPFYFLDTGGQQVVSFVKNDNLIDVNKLYNVTVDEYMGAYGRTCGVNNGRPYHDNAEAWYPVAELLVQDYTATQALSKGLRKAQNSRSLTPVIAVEARGLLQKLQEHDFLSIEDESAEGIECTILDKEKRQFLGGDWLEVYVWYQTQQKHFADDCQWGRTIKIDRKLTTIIESITPRDDGAFNELDVLLTYQARLLIAECKTSIDPFDSAYLNKLYAITNLIGMGYVRQVFITNCPRPQGKNRRFDNFCKQAEARRITVITGDELPIIGKRLQEEIERKTDL